MKLRNASAASPGGLRVKLMRFLGGGWNSLKINGFGISANKQ